MEVLVGSTKFPEIRLEDLFGFVVFERGKVALDELAALGLAGEDFMNELNPKMFRTFGFLVENGSGVEVASDKVGVFEFVVFGVNLDGVKEESGLMGLKEARLELIAEAHHAGGAAWVEEVEGVGCVVFWRGFVAVEDGSVDEGSGLNKIFFGIPVFETVGDGGENVTPFSEPTSGLFEKASTVIFVAKRADFGAEGASGGLGDITGAKRPKGEEGLDGGQNSPNENNNEDDR